MRNFISSLQKTFYIHIKFCKILCFCLEILLGALFKIFNFFFKTFKKFIKFFTVLA